MPAVQLRIKFSLYLSLSLSLSLCWIDGSATSEPFTVSANNHSSSHWEGVEIFFSTTPAILDVLMAVEIQDETWFLCSSKLSFSSIFVNSLVVASWRRRWGGGMWLSTGSHASGIGRKVPVMIRMVSFNCESIKFVWDDLDETGAQYSVCSECWSLCAPWRSRHVAKKVISSAEFRCRLFQMAAESQGPVRRDSQVNWVWDWTRHVTGICRANSVGGWHLSLDGVVENETRCRPRVHGISSGPWCGRGTGRNRA